MYEQPLNEEKIVKTAEIFFGVFHPPFGEGGGERGKVIKHHLSAAQAFPLPSSAPVLGHTFNLQS